MWTLKSPNKKIFWSIFAQFSILWPNFRYISLLTPIIGIIHSEVHDICDLAHTYAKSWTLQYMIEIKIRIIFFMLPFQWIYFLQSSISSLSIILCVRFIFAADKSKLRFLTEFRYFLSIYYALQVALVTTQICTMALFEDYIFGIVCLTIFSK